MKCIVLSCSEYKKKDGSGTGHIANIAFIRNAHISIDQVFNLSDIHAGDVVDIDFDSKGYHVSHQVIGSSDAVDLLIGELQHL